MRVLLVEDDQMLGTAVLQALHDASYAVDWVQDGVTASSALDSSDYELVLLDLGLPQRDGIDVLRCLRARADATPVLVITARDSVDQRIEGLDVGAVDDLGKPFAVSELLARLRTLLRRSAGATSSALSNGIYGWGEEVESNAVDLIIHGLRRKLGADAIRNVRGLGWHAERTVSGGGAS